MIKLIRFFSLLLAVLIFCISALVFFGYFFIPDSSFSSKESICYNGLFYAQSTEKASFDSEGAVRVTAEVKLMNLIPVKKITLVEPARRYVVPGGELIGIKLQADGVVVIGTESFTGENGTVCPANEAGITTGDIITEINGEKLLSAAQLNKAIKDSHGNSISLKLVRNGATLGTVLQPERSESSDIFKGGLWIRDSLGGIGTLTYTDMENGTLAALGHGIYDVDTKAILPSNEGTIFSATISNIEKGVCGKAGQICGTINSNQYGILKANTDWGIYGYINTNISHSEAIPVAFSDEVHTGEASILCTVSNGEKKSYSVNIDKLGSAVSGGKDMIISVTDATLLADRKSVV